MHLIQYIIYIAELGNTLTSATANACFLVWGGGFVTSNLGIRNSASPVLSCFDWKGQLLRGFLRVDKEPRQECARFR
jgi:hypothetical protein